MLREHVSENSLLRSPRWGRVLQGEGLMEVIHRRCSGLDVHKETVVACVRLVLDDKNHARSQDLRDHDVRVASLAGMVD